MKKIIPITFFCAVMLLGISTWSQDSEPAPQSIEDVTLADSILKEESFKTTGPLRQLSLQEAIDTAIENNPQMRIARHALQGSLANLDLTESNYRNKFNVDSSLSERIRRVKAGSFRIDPDKGLIQDDIAKYENNTLFNIGPRYNRQFKNGSFLEISPSIVYEKDSDALFDRSSNHPGGYNYEERYRVNLSYNYPLNSRPREQIRNAIENSKLSTIQSDYSLYMREKSTIQQVINSYWNIQRLLEDIDITREQLLQSKQIEFIVKVQYENESVAQDEVGVAQIQVMNNEATLISTEGNLKNSIESFNMLLGLPIDTQLELKDPFEVTPLPMSADKYVDLVTSTNLELKSLRLSLRQQNNSLRVTRMGQQPDLTLGTTANQDDEGRHNISASLNFSWAFGDGGATRARVRAAEESLERLKINLWDTERQLIQDTYNDLRALQLQTQRIEILKRNVEQATRNMDNGLYNYQNYGQITFRNIQDLQLELARARTNLVNAMITYNINKTNLLQKVHDYKPSDEIKPLLGILD